MSEFEVCRKRTPEEEQAVAEAEAKRACGCWTGAGPDTYLTCDKRWWQCGVTPEMWRNR